MANPREGGGAPQPGPGAYLGLGIEIAAPIVLLMYAGYRLDGWLETYPWGFVVGSFLGGAVGFYSFFRRVLPPRQGPKGEGR